jgi:hypothetical protein
MRVLMSPARVAVVMMVRFAMILLLRVLAVRVSALTLLLTPAARTVRK